MLKFIGRRLIQIVLLFLAYLTFIFFLLQAQPGDVTDQFIGNPEHPARGQGAARRALGARQIGLGAVLRLYR